MNLKRENQRQAAGATAVLNAHAAWYPPFSMAFDYNSPAELFMPKRKGSGGRRAATGYRRFATAAEAIRFAVEEFPAIGTLGAWMQVGDERFDNDEIGRLYAGSDYPLERVGDVRLA